MPNLKLDIDNTVRARAATGDMHFSKDGRHVPRLFGDEQGLYLENTRTGAVSRVFLESALAPLVTRVAAQQTTLDALTRELAALRAEIAKAAGADKLEASHPAP